MASGVNVLTPLNDGRFVVGGLFTHVDGQPRGCIACTDTLGDLLDCWAGGGLVPEAYTPGGGPLFGLGGFKCLSNGDCYIFGEYKGFIDANGLHPRQCLMSRINLPDVGVENPLRTAPRTYLWYDNSSRAILFHTPGNGQFLVHDICGRRLREGVFRSGTTTVDIGNLPSSVYFIQLAFHNGSLDQFKFITP